MISPRSRPGMIGSVGRRGERLELHQLGDAAHRDPRLLPGVEDLGELLDRREEQVDVEDEGDEGARGEVPRGDQPGADPEHDGVGHPREELDEGEVDGHQPLRRHPGLEVVAAQAVEALDGLGLVHEGLGHPHAREALLEVGVDDGDPFPRQVVEPGRLAPEDHRGDGQGDDDRERAQPELEVDDHQGDPHADEGDDRDQRREQPVLDERFELVDVGGHPGHDPARHLPLVVVQARDAAAGPRCGCAATA